MPYVLAKLQRNQPLERTLLSAPIIDQALQHVSNLDVAALRYKANWDRQDYVAVANYINTHIDPSAAIVVVEDIALPGRDGALTASLSPSAVLRSTTDFLACAISVRR